MSGALALLSDADRDAARLNVELGVALLAAGRPREAVEPLERALDLAQALELPHVLAGALTFKAQVCVALSRSREARILFAGAIELCREYGFSDRLLIVQLNSGDFLRKLDLPGAAEQTGDALATARRVGSRVYESVAASTLMRVWEYTGAWDDVERLGDRAARGPPPSGPEWNTSTSGSPWSPPSAGTRKWPARHLDGMSPVAPQRSERGPAGRTRLARPRSRSSRVTPLRRWMACRARWATSSRPRESSSPASRIGFPTAIEAAVARGGRSSQATALLRLLAEVPPGPRPAVPARGTGPGGRSGRRARGRHSHGPGSASAPRSRSSTQPRLSVLARSRPDRSGPGVDRRRPECEEAQPVLDEAVAELRKLRAAPALAVAEALLAGLPAAVRG